ncbi:MAG: hypothetical protein JW828_01855 [Sedimentisphaerales bacterium]|nr:hypothetical protein [Sedimentisphaerales bacterium]
MILAKDNPFRINRIKQIRYQPVGESWDQLLQRLAERKYCGAIVGPCGSGKTTLLEDLQKHLDPIHISTQSMFINQDIHPSRHEIEHILSHPPDILLVDGGDHLSRGTWRQVKNRILRTGRGLVVTSHKGGLLPTWVECRPHPQLFIGITEQLLCSSGHRPLDADFLTRLFFRHKGNIRDALRELYDRMADDVREDANVLYRQKLLKDAMPIC